MPAWLAPQSGAGGGRLRASRGGAEGLARIVLRYVDRYLLGLEGAPRVDDAQARANERTARDVANVIRAHGPARKHLAKTFGERAAERAMRLFWALD